MAKKKSKKKSAKNKDLKTKLKGKKAKKEGKKKKESNNGKDKKKKKRASKKSVKKGTEKVLENKLSDNRIKNIMDELQKPEPVVEVVKPPVSKPAANIDHSSNYNVKDAVAKIRLLKTKEEVLSFTMGEKRVTVTRVLTAAVNKFEN